MKSIMVTYPGFPTLPKGLKQMLLVSEEHFFAEARTAWPAAMGAQGQRWPASLASVKSGAAGLQRAVQTINPRRLSDGIMNGAHFYKSLLKGMDHSSSES